MVPPWLPRPFFILAMRTLLLLYIVVAVAAVLVYWLVLLALDVGNDTDRAIIGYIIAGITLVCVVMDWRQQQSERQRQEWLRRADETEKAPGIRGR